MVVIAQWLETVRQAQGADLAVGQQRVMHGGREVTRIGQMQGVRVVEDVQTHRPGLVIVLIHLIGGLQWYGSIGIGV